MKTTRLILGIIIVGLLSAGGYWGYANYMAPVEPTPTPETEPVLQETGPTIISAQGRVVPMEFVTLSFNTGGLVEQVFVQKGDLVTVGQLLVRLENQEQIQAELTSAQLELIAARQDLDELYDQDELRAAQAQMAMAEAREAIERAERRLNNLARTASQADIDQAYANMILARDALEKAEENFEPYEDKPEDNLVRATLLSKKAQAQQDYDDAVRLYNNLRSTGDEIDVEKAEAQLALAQAQLADAEREYEILQSGPDPDEVELAQARVSNAEAQLEAAQAALEDLELKAPFEGTLISFHAKEGQIIAPGEPVAVLADISKWQIETTDLAENDVAFLSTGMSALITLDAIPDQEIEGTITEIGLQGEDYRGSVTYPVTIAFDPGELPVRWEMTAFVDIRLP